jgi:hypothetical protein
MFWYLVFAVLLATGQPAATVAHPYTTEAECQAEGDSRSSALVSDNKVDRAAWQCLAIDFSKVDPKTPEDAARDQLENKLEKLFPGDRKS